jgi:DNA-binding HxlR family transcriptional regulator
MNPTTPEERDDLIVKTIEKSDGIGFNRLQKETGIPKKTLVKYLNEMIKDKIISKKMKGEKLSSGVRYTVNFSEHTKEAINHNLGQISKYHKWYTGTKFRKSNTFPHYLQELAAEYYQNIMSFLFDNVPAYKFGVKRMEEILDLEKKRLDKEFKGKSKVRLWEACQQVQFYLFDNASDSIYHAADRNNHRTIDEIKIDCINPRKLDMGTQQERLKKVRAQVISTGNITVEKYRVDYIKDEKIKKLFIELAEEYDQLSWRLLTIKYRLAGITGSYPFEPPNTESWDDI